MITVGKNFLLKICLDDENKYESLGGLYITKFTLKNNFLELNNIKKTFWREINAASEAYMSISANGIYTSSASENIIQRNAFSGKIKKYKLCFGNHSEIIGNFLVIDYERSGKINEIETYSLSLESSGALELI